MSRTKTVVSTLLAALVATAGLLAPRPAAAANINTSAFGCLQSYPYNQPNGGLGADLGGSGSKPDAISVTGANSMLLACPVSRSPIDPNVYAYASIYIDGKQPSSGYTMACTVQSYNFDNTFLGSVAVSSSAATFDLGALLPTADAPMYAYFIASCFLNTGGQQKLLGFTTYQ